MILVKKMGTLKALYMGPYEVVCKADQSFTILKNHVTVKENIKKMKEVLPKLEVQQGGESPNKMYDRRTTRHKASYEELSDKNFLTKTETLSWLVLFSLENQFFSEVSKFKIFSKKL